MTKYLRLPLAILIGGGVALGYQALTDVERIDQAKVLVEPLASNANQTVKDEIGHVLTHLDAAKLALAGTPPPPIDCAVGPWSMDSATEWTACSGGSQTRDETWSRSVTQQPENGGAACPRLTEVRTVTQACTETPVDCVLGPWTMTSAKPWGTCTNGSQTREETWIRPIVTQPSGGGAACGITTETRTGTQSCTAQTEICGNGVDDDGDGQVDEGCQPPPTGDHGYFDMLSKRGDVLRTYSLRDTKQLATRANGGYAMCNKCSLDVTYDPVNDPDPRKQDAAKVVIGTGANSLRNQLHLPIPQYTGSLMVTWDAWMGDEFRYAVSGIPTYKHFQLASGQSIWTEPRSRFSNAAPGKIAMVDVRYYGVPGNGQTKVTDALSPMLHTFHTSPETWTRYWVLIEPIAGQPWFEFSMWMADENTDPVQILDKRWVHTRISGGRWDEFWLEYNTSTDAVKSGRPQLVSYVRNVVMLHGVNTSAVPALLVKPQ